MRKRWTFGAGSWLLLLLGLLWLGPACAASQVPANDGCHYGPIQVYDSPNNYNLASCIWYLKDPSRNLTIDDVRNPAEATHFREHHEGVMNFGYTHSAYWIRFQLDYQGQRRIRDWVLELALPLVDHAKLFLYDGDKLEETRETGYWVPLDKRDIAVPNPSFRLHLPKDKITTVYLRIYTENTFRLPIHLMTMEAFAHKVSVEEAVQGIFLGGMIALLAYNLFMAISVRERSHWIYCAYLLGITLFVLTEQVHGQQLFGTRPAFLNKNYLHLDILFSWVFAIWMAREVLETKSHAPSLDHVLRLSNYAVASTIAISFFMPYHLSIKWTVYFSVFLSVEMIVVSYRAWSAYNPAAWSYFFAWLGMLVSVGIYATTVLGYLPFNSLTAHMPQMGIMSQVILLSFALADRIKEAQRDARDWNERAVANLKRYRSLFNNAIEGIFRVSLSRRFLDANPAMADILGFRRARDLMRGNWDAFALCFADSPVRQAMLEALQREGRLKAVEVRYRTQSGQLRWANVSMRTVYNEDGEPLHLEGTFVDVTERREREEIEKERENERMEKELARNSAEAKSQFLANMSHEIRTPLAAIIGYGETLLDPALDSEEKHHSAETVVRSGRHLLDLVNDILDHSKIDANKLEVEVLEVSLPELLDEVRAFFAPRARERGLDFAITCEFPLPEMIRTDPTRFRQILINLCGNALKFTDRGSIQVAMRCDPEREQIIARVIDTGIGMKPEQMTRLFDPFAQGSAAIARQYGGTGLGLSISRRLAQLLGGDIRVRSTYGEGSEFEVSIASGPLQDIHFIRDASEMSQRRRQLPIVEAPHLRGRILCAEDNEVNRKLVDLLVSRTGAEVVHVGNGAEALEAVSRAHFDLVLMDIQMPVMNGRDATHAMRSAGYNLPIVALTANVMAEDIQDYRDAGCTDYLAKPIDKRRFYELLARHLQVDAEPVVAGLDASSGLRFQGTVLVAEDNRDNRLLVERMLERLGLQVIAVESGREAVQQALAQTVHLILMDSHMPELEGAQATGMLRQTGFHRPIIAFTAGDQQEIDDLLQAGCDGILHKPINNDQLIALLRKHVELADVTRQAMGLEDEAIAALQGQFLDGLPDRLERMRAALAQADWATLRQEAHQIKGTAGAMGYPRMTEKAGELDRVLKADDEGRARQLFPDLERMIEHALKRRTATRDS